MNNPNSNYAEALEALQSFETKKALNKIVKEYNLDKVINFDSVDFLPNDNLLLGIEIGNRPAPCEFYGPFKESYLRLSRKDRIITRLYLRFLVKTHSWKVGFITHLIKKTVKYLAFSL